MTAVAPTSITATDITVDKGKTIAATNYVVNATGLTAGQYVYNYVTATSDNTSVATVTNNNGTFTINGVEEGTAVITITAFKTDDTTTACTTTFTVTVQDIQTGVSGGTVTLYDYEDHKWTYYSGVDASVDGGNYNSNYVGKLYSPNPRNVKITYKANGGAVSINESETEFVYYKTIEKVNGAYNYTVISNPFSKRPNGKGFGGWKIKEGAQYINGYADEAVLPLDAELTLTGLDDNYTPNCTSAEIELEATWVNLNNITYASGNTFTYEVSGGTYETNILVLNRNVTGTITTTSPVTIMMVEPDGSSDYRGTYTFSGNITPNNNGVTKIEYARWTTTNAINATGRDFTIGRGIVRPSGGGTLYGTNTSSNINQTFKVESGIYQAFYAIGANGPQNNMTKQHIILGNDYDRAKSDNDNLTITNNMMLLNRVATIGTDRLIVTTKSGKFTTELDHSTAQASGNCFYLWNNNSTNGSTGVRTLIIEGGELWHIAGGVDYANNNNTVNLKIRMKGGTVHGSIYGGAARYDAHGGKQFVFTGGTVEGWIAGGSNGFLSEGTGNDNGSTQGNSYVYVGGTTQVNSGGSTTAINVSLGGNVYGAGCGNEEVNVSGRVTLGTNVVVADKSYVERGVYGGGAYGGSPETANVYITGNAHVGGVADATFNVQGGVYGGARAKGGGSTNIYMTGGLVETGLYGGSNRTGTLTGSVTMQINGGQVGTTSKTANIHGGGYGQPTIVSQNVDITLGTSGQTTKGVTVYGDVYGGSALGYVNGTAATNTYHTYVTMYKGTINGSLYGGGLGDSSNLGTGHSNVAANVYGPVQVKVYGGSVKKTSVDGSGGVYGGNNVNGAPQRSVTVDIYGTDPAPSADEYALYAVYGGGNAADYTYGNGYPTVTVHNCDNSIEYVYGGGNAAAVAATNVTIWGGNKIGNVFGGGNGTVTAANVNGNAVTKIYGGTIGKVFGGSNSQGTISGSISVTVQKQDGDSDPDGSATACAMHIDEVYGGGNLAASNVGNITIGCMNAGDMINYVYGGSNNAAITGNINLTMTGGRIENLFGGNNTGSTISGTITVNVNWDGSCPDSYLGNVFGGGNHAAYDKTPAVTITNGTVTHNVYGGGNEAGVAGGNVRMVGGTVLGGIYGGCNTSGTVTGNIAVNVTGGTVGSTTTKANIFGGGYGSATETEGNVDVTINGAAVNIYGDVYGGSALGNVNSDTDDYTHVLLTAGTIYGDVYGGGLGDDTHAALVNGNVTVTQNGVAFVKGTTTDDKGNTVVTAGRIFGCNNLNGSPQGSVLVLVNKTSDNPTEGTYDMNAVYGGGNLAPYNPGTIPAAGQFTSYTKKGGGTATHDATGKPIQVVINGCDNVSVEYVYGGGNAAPTPCTDVLVLGAYELGYVFGGGNGKDRYTRDGGAHWNANPGADVGLINNTEYGNGNANTLLYGGKIHEAYGASNQKGTIKGSINLDVKEGEVDCNLEVGKIVGAGKNADVDGDINLVMGCMPADKKTNLVFGGADNANVDGNVELTITSGTFGQVFGGNNLGGIIKGHIKLNIEETGCNPIRIDELYLGGNEAAYSINGYYEDGTLADGRTKYSPRTSASDSHTAVTGNHTAPYAQPVLNVISCTYIGKVFGGGLGTGAAMYANPTVNLNMIKGAFSSAISTDEGNNPNQLGNVENVYGGGNQAAVHGNTLVNIATEIGQDIVLNSPEDATVTNRTKQVLGAYVTGTVYGAGKGVTTNPSAAVVTGNTKVVMKGGLIRRSIYGGGELSSVGTVSSRYTAGEYRETAHPYHAIDEPKTFADNTGLTEVLISGGQVGLVNQKMPDPNNPTSDDDYGYVFCAGKGLADSTSVTGSPNANLLAVSASSHLVIEGTALIAASVYGGSENGQVVGDTHVEIKGGQIGSGYYKDGSNVDHWDPAYTETQWTTAINKIKAGTFADADASGFHECDAWPFGTEGNRHVYDYFHGTAGYDSKGGGKPGSDGHSYYGHVFGGGSGYYPWAAGKWRRTAGRVNGNTEVIITGGHILTNVYGGNEITDVLGKSKVEMTGGTVGVPRTIAGIQARPVNSYIFGAGMGDPRTLFNGWSNVGSSEVIVHGNAVVFGSVFGGGEDGHVLGNSSTTIKGNALIGTFGTSGVDGNIFGSGRGFSALSLTAGTVCGNVTVEIQENAKILGSIYGGGRLAAVGTYLAAEGTANYGKLIAEGQDPYGTGSTKHGNVTVNITGGTIGTLAGINSTHDFSVGDVFGGSKGTLLYEWSRNQKLGLVKNTEVNISGDGTLIYGNVYGGGEIASVGHYEYATAEEVTAYNAANPSVPLSEGDVNRLLEAGTGVAKINITGGIIGQNDVTDTHGHVFGGCLGRAGTQYSGYSFVNTSDVTLNGGTVYGCVFGGGENGHVLADTDVKIKSGTVGIALDKSKIDDDHLSDNMIYRGNVYGGGRGIDKTTGGNYSITAGKVTGNTNVTIEGGTVYRAVYGGGSLASVGNPDEKAKTDLQPNGTYYSTGLATVTIKGGRIGSDGGASANTFTGGTPGREHRRENGFVFGSGRGMAAGALGNAQFSHLAYVKNTVVNIESGATVTGSVFGGGENGHVRHDTKVYVQGGSIGTALTAIEQEIDNSGRSRLIYRGNVYGGGRGVDRNNEDKLSKTAGRVYGNAYVEVNDGQIYHDVFGGGELGSVGTITNSTKTEGTPGTLGGQSMMFGFLLSMPYTFEYDKDASGKATTGLCTVKVNGGTVGGDVFGASRGQAGEIYEMAEIANIINSDVYIGADGSSSTTSPDIHGSVYGGGENGHILEDAHVTINGGLIGQSVFGSGQGTDKYAKKLKRWEDNSEYDGEAYSLTAGKVYGNTYVDMKGGLVTVNVYGGGKLASIGKGNYSGGLDDYFPMGYGETINGNLWDGVSTESKLFLGTGKATVKVTGGTVGSVNGIDATGRMTTGNVFGGSQGEAAPNIFNQPADDYNPVFHLANINEADVTIGTEGSATGPRIYGSVYGGGQDGHMRRDAKVTVYSGEIGNAYNDANKTAVGTSDLNNLQWEQRGNVFGAGSGFGLYSFDYDHDGKTYTDTNGNGRYDDGEPIDTYEYGGQTYYDMGVSYLAGCVARFSEVNIKGGIIHRNVYGGGSVAGTGEPKFGYQTFEPYKKGDPAHGQGTQSQSTVTVSGGTIGESGYGGNVFGASRGNELLLEADERLTTCIWTEVNIEGGTIWSDVYGGGELGTVKQDTEVNLYGGEIYGSVYGGGKGTSAVAADIGSTLPTPPVLGGNTSVFLNGSTATGATNDCKVRGNIFGCNNINGTPKGHALVHIYKTEGYDDSHKKSAAKDNTTYDVAAVYGGGNMAAYEPKSDAEFSEVIIDGCDFTSIQYVYGGGNAASAPATYVKVNATYEIGTVFGGGNGKDNLPNGDPNPGAHVGYKADGSTSYGTGQAKVDALGGTIHNVFGGSNTKGNIRSEAVAFLDQQDDTCPLVLGEVYGGGNEAYMEGGSSLKLGCISSLKNLYGGANDAPVGGDINLTVTSGRFERVFGGNNKGGTISGSITVNIEETGCHPIIIGELYGCGNKAGYSATTMQPTINVKSFTSIGRVFGGGLGETAIVEGNPIVNVNVVLGEKKDGEPTDTEFFDAEGNFKGWNIEFKDGTDPDVVTSTVSLPTHTKGKIGAIGTIFGGGNAAKVQGSTTVRVGTDDTISYESGSDHTAKTVVGADIRGNVFGGGNAAEVTGNTNVEIGQKKTTP